MTRTRPSELLRILGASTHLPVDLADGYDDYLPGSIVLQSIARSALATSGESRPRATPHPY